LWPFSTLGWPEQTPDLARYYPNSVLVTAYDILFFWVARMIMMGLKFMGRPPFEQVYFNGLVRDEKGRKMSKTRGNTVDPLDLMDRFGTDALRFTLAAMASPGADTVLDLKRVEGYQAFGTKIWNAARFVLLNLPEGTEATKPEFRASSANLSITDRWIISRVNAVSREVDQALEQFRYDEAASTLYHFVWHEFCDWYIEMVKPSLIGDARDTLEGRRSRAILLRVLDRALRLLHPFMPFLTEEIWQRLPHEGETLVLVDYPHYREEEEDSDAEKEVGFLIAAVTKLRNLRAESNLPAGLKLEALFHTDLSRPRRIVESHAATLCTLARLSAFRFVAEIPGDLAAARGVIPGLEMALPLAGVQDPHEERRRLEREMEKAQKELAGLEAKLANESFTGRAPQDVVAKVREASRELRERIEKLSRAASELPLAGLSSGPE
ncbi:MAG: class I tRNA ligase family protein, partial [Acidobacteria bacterium]|nr:class I tRNA ligase family protein [Acidobacteriota bacterium]